MTGTEFAELAEWIRDRWGTGDPVWANADRFASDFADLESEDVWAALYAKGTGQWAPRPPELTSGAKEQMRNRLRPERQAALPAPKGASWSEWCIEKFGEVRTFEDVVRERHIELEGTSVRDQSARLPSEDGWLDEGIELTVTCRSPICDIHRGTA